MTALDVTVLFPYYLVWGKEQSLHGLSVHCNMFFFRVIWSAIVEIHLLKSIVSYLLQRITNIL